jgi:periplasmic protein TonB
MAEKINIFNDEWCDIVFEDRNKEYGAYQLRKRNDRNIVIGIVFAIVTFSLGVSAPVILKYIEGIMPDKVENKMTEVTTLEEPPPIDKTQPPPPPVEPPPPLKSTVKFTPPIIKPDEEVKDEPPPPVEVLKDIDAGKATVQGDPNAEVVLEEEPSMGDGQVFLSVEQMPEFPGGEAAMLSYITSHIVYPPMAKENGITGKVFVSFVIGPDGKVKDAKTLRGIGGGCDEEALRVINSMPGWKPGKQNGKPVNVQFNIPIKFSLR